MSVCVCVYVFGDMCSLAAHSILLPRLLLHSQSPSQPVVKRTDGGGRYYAGRKLLAADQRHAAPEDDAHFASFSDNLTAAEIFLFGGGFDPEPVTVSDSRLRELGFPVPTQPPPEVPGSRVAAAPPPAIAFPESPFIQFTSRERLRQQPRPPEGPAALWNI